MDFITSLDGYGAAEGWPGWWGLQGPEYLDWLGQDSEGDYTTLMGANTYRLMYGFTLFRGARDWTRQATSRTPWRNSPNAPKVVFSSTLEAPLSWANTQLVSEDPVEAVGTMKRDGPSPMRTLGSLTLCRSLLEAGPGGPFPGGRFPCDHRENWPRPDL